MSTPRPHPVNWFHVDHAGLAALNARRSAAFIVFELLQNAWDEETTQVHVTLTPVAGQALAEFVVEDNNPNGFHDLSHSFTLFADSTKKGNPEKRGRFNLGEKLVLASCREAEIISTTGGVRFDAAGRHTLRRKRDSGSCFSAIVRLTREQLAECEEAVQSVLPPPGISTIFNGRTLPQRSPLAVVTAALPTEIAGADRLLRRTERQTTVEVHEVRGDEKAMIFELGIPIVATGDRFHVNVMQKVPLAMERDSVTPAYLARVRAVVLAHLIRHLTPEDASSTWVRHAMQKHGSEMPTAVVTQLAELRFGPKRVSYDPTDPEANKLATSEGYTVVPGGSLSAPEWEAIRRAGAILPAGRVTPSPKPYSPDGRPQVLLPFGEWTPAMRAVGAFAERMGERLLGATIEVDITNDRAWPFAATYGPRDNGQGGRLTLNLGRLGHAWCEGPLEPIADLLIHEFGHHYCSDHLSRDYLDALTKLGAQMVLCALLEPGMFEGVGATRATGFCAGQG